MSRRVSEPSDRGLVVFDCDGVLVDSERLVVDIDVAAIASLGWEITRDEVIAAFVGKSDADMRTGIEQHIGRSLPTDWDQEWQAEYRRVLDEELEAVPGSRRAVATLTSLGWASCVASSGDHAKMRRTLTRTGHWQVFEGRIFSATEVPHGKPAPDLFLHAAATLGFEPARCVVVEDSGYGVAAARAAGMAVVGYAGGITPAGQLSDADEVLTDMADLPAAVCALVE